MSKKKNFLTRTQRFFINAKQDGVIWTISRIFLKIFKTPNEIERKKIKVLNHLIQIHDYKVAHGIFKGMKLNKNLFWSKHDLITHILGVYEQHILDQLIKFSNQDNEIFIDIGAADGYFAVGSAFSKLFKKVYAFEIQKNGRESLKFNAEANLCDKNIIINSEANFNSLKNLIDKHSRAVVLIDIEGDEFKLLDFKTLNLLSNCKIIIELHPEQVVDGLNKQKELINFSKKLFDISLIKRETYNPNVFEELDHFTDEERLIAFAEGRDNNMRWLILEPKK